MSKKIIAFSWLLFWGLILAPQAMVAGEVQDRLAAANQSFDKQEYTQALETYQDLYRDGYFNEVMLYRLAFMYENLKNYPEAIYYLKKAVQEYGNDDSDSKIRQMMQVNGSARVFTADGWDAYFLFYHRFGTIFMVAFALLGIAMAVSLILPARKPNTLRSLAKVGGWSTFAVLGIFFFHHFLFSPHRAVLVEKTSFYDFPGYAGNSMPNMFSLGETVAVTDEEDIWALVEAGGREFWVPKRVLRDL